MARRILWLLAPVAILAAVVLRTSELSTLREVFVSAAPPALLAAAVLAAAFTVNQGALYRGVFRIFATEIALGDAVLLSLVMAFASLALPAGTASGIAFFVTAARDRGIAASRALLTGLAYYLFDYAALTPVLLLGLMVLHLHHDLGPASLAAVGFFYIVALTVAALVAWGLIQPQFVASRIARANAWLRRRLRWTRRLLPQRSSAFGDEIQEILTQVRAQPLRAIPPLLHAAILQVISIALLAVVFAALDYRLAPAVLIAGYAVGAVFMVVSITPSGAGVVEAGMTLTLTSLGVPLEVAAAGTILYRLYTFWLPMVAGFLTLRLLRPAQI
ncbi:MAG: lysylphosphatidylglycerol synthase transmembrane domain-containing protein [Armatimonadota bacterium]|nr:lysylphosphatidylglycerol synthase transmembrane domain-containing protein [Armatimonadota bacterium]MDR7450804.1 lysylphosphatidylglycerol synthase transmembrane domain-containing protein [Armatimonadota bacterium]MDR7466160.1 lysylphosphatidylglycerol synthase transmembrane domain-containing protein [Armatimonadota bacterium]MDR7493803.1 lysylphosphatidylglycerol synthase transmembrane domain-containing protein [Armatimonadota bacterium]MDR7499036.1 lysylphosphatidylglycerol synthase trans